MKWRNTAPCNVKKNIGGVLICSYYGLYDPFRARKVRRQPPHATCPNTQPRMIRSQSNGQPFLDFFIWIYPSIILLSYSFDLPQVGKTKYNKREVFFSPTTICGSCVSLSQVQIVEKMVTEITLEHVTSILTCAYLLMVISFVIFIGCDIML
jgi:hypothetical protein